MESVHDTELYVWTWARFGGHEANIEAFTETQWVTIQSEIATYPF